MVEAAVGGKDQFTGFHGSYLFLVGVVLLLFRLPLFRVVDELRLGVSELLRLGVAEVLEEVLLLRVGVAELLRVGVAEVLEEVLLLRVGVAELLRVGVAELLEEVLLSLKMQKLASVN